MTRRYSRTAPPRQGRLEDIDKLSDFPEVVAAASRRGVKRVVHFTTMSGAIGILASGEVKSREHLPEDKYLEHVYRPNADQRKDPAWTGYVNLSIERINGWMFSASNRWHPEDVGSWVLLSFDPQILGHPGVVFTTTNNIYPSCRRAEGVDGFNAMFANMVKGRYDETHDRTGKKNSWPTDRQAEVLYPRGLSCEYLQQISVQEEEKMDTIQAALQTLHSSSKNLDPDLCVRHAPEEFQ